MRLIKLVLSLFAGFVVALSAANAKGVNIVKLIKRVILSEPSPPEPEPEPEPPAAPPDDTDMDWPTPYSGMEPGEQNGDSLDVDGYDTKNILLLSDRGIYAEVIDGKYAIESVDSYIDSLIEQWVRGDAGIDDTTGHREFENNVANAKRIVEEDPDYIKIKVHINNIQRWPVTGEDANAASVMSAPASSLEALGRAIEYYEAALSISAQPGALERAADAYLVRGQYYYINRMNNLAFKDYARAITLTWERIMLMEYDESGVEVRNRSHLAELLSKLGLIYYRMALTDNGSVMLECYVLSSAFYKLAAERYLDNSAVMARNYTYAAMMNHRIIYQMYKQIQCRNFIIEALALYTKVAEYESTPERIQSLQNLLSYAKAYNAYYPGAIIDISDFTGVIDGK